MNKREYFLILTLLVVILISAMTIFFKTKKEVLNDYFYYIKLEKKVKEVYALKRKYEIDYSKINRLKRFCNIKDDEKLLISCNNLDKSKFDIVSNLIFRSNFNIKKFSINKDKNISLNVEIIK